MSSKEKEDRVARASNIPNPARRIARGLVREGIPALSSQTREMLINSITIHARRSGVSVEEVSQAVITGISHYAGLHPEAKLDDIAFDTMGWLRAQDEENE